MTSFRDIVKYLEKIVPPSECPPWHPGTVEIGGRNEYEQMRTTVNKIVIATYPSSRAVTRASQEKANLMIIYRPLFAEPLSSLTGKGLTRMRILVKNYISVYVVGGGYIGARDGLSDALIKLLEFDRAEDFTVSWEGRPFIVGRAATVPVPMNHSRLSHYISEKLGISSVQFTGDVDADVRKVVVVPGSRFSERDILAMHERGLSTLFTGEITPRARLLGYELGLNIIEAGPFVTEEPGMRLLKSRIALGFPELRVEFVDSSSPTQMLQYRAGRR